MAKTKPRTKARIKQTLTITEAAQLVGMTSGGIRAAIARGDIPVNRAAKPFSVQRAHVLRFRREMDEARKPTPKNRVLTDEEFIQALWDSDPD
ncbi:MAG: hypothetical protein SFX73_25130 [Kofleriaceae bacterium]|nr:hypothetical protein [Kofleriaceae bacterium]